MRRKLLKALTVGALSLSFFINSPDIKPTSSFAWDDYSESKWSYSKHGWFYTREKTKKIYEKEYEEGARLENFIKIEEGKHIASYHGEKFEINQKFVKKTLKQLEGMLEKGFAEYIFRLDAFHSHLFIPNNLFHQKYAKMEDSELHQELSEEDKLGALYHNTEHLALRDPPKTGKIDPIAKELLSKRSVLGWYDNRPLELTYPTDDAPPKIKEANNASIPEGYHNITNLTFKATKNGEFTITHKGKEIRVDLSFDANEYY